MPPKQYEIVTATRIKSNITPGELLLLYKNEPTTLKRWEKKNVEKRLRSNTNSLNILNDI